MYHYPHTMCSKGVWWGSLSRGRFSIFDLLVLAKLDQLLLKMETFFTFQQNELP